MELELKDIDRLIWEDELADFVPKKLYDAHTHIYDWRADSPNVSSETPPPAGVWANWPLSNRQMLTEIDALLFPGRQVHRISFGNPLQTCSLDQGNHFVAQQLAGDQQSIGLSLARPGLTGSEVEEQLQRYGFCGLKPYRLHAVTGDAVECNITDYLPEAQIEVVDHYGFIVMLHLSKSKAIADPGNLDDLERLTTKYPNVKWVLAHCARSYYDVPLMKAADRLKTTPNLWYDISSVCDSDAMDVLLSIAGADRVMYGSDDIAVGVTRGKYITFGHSWASLDEHNHNFDLSYCQGEMTFTRYESLRALRRACRRHSYGPNEIAKLFYSNAKELVHRVQNSVH